MKRKIMSIISGIILLSIIGCSANNNTISTDTLSENSISTTNISNNTVSSNSEIIEDLPYFEANNFNITSERSFKIPFKPYITDSEFTSIKNIDGITVEETPTATYTIESISRNESENPEYKNITITFSIELPFELFFDGNKYKGDDWAYGIKYADFELFDYNTGNYIPNKSLFNNEEYYNTANICYEDKNISISVNKIQNLINDSVSFNKISDENELFSLPVNTHCQVIYIISIPNDYNNLVLSLYKDGITNIDSLDFEKENTDRNFESILSQNEGSTGSDYYTIMLNNL